MYPAGNVAANVVGFVGSDGKGLGGLEYQYQNLLAGKAGQLTVQVGHDGQVIPDGVGGGQAAVPGQGIQLTIDRDIQWKAQQAIAAQVKATGADGGSVIVMQPRTGQILAMATTPTFDPADPGAAPAEDRGNAALSDVFEPGSTNKVITMSAAIDSGVLDSHLADRRPADAGARRQGLP